MSNLTKEEIKEMQDYISEKAEFLRENDSYPNEQRILQNILCAIMDYQFAFKFIKTKDESIL